MIVSRPRAGRRGRHLAGALVILGALIGSRPPCLFGQDEWARADQDTPRLTPAAFQKIPPKVVAAMEARRCTIPQSWADTAVHNVIKGAFENRNQVDYAVLCSRARASTILIIPGGPNSCPDEMEVREDKSYLRKIAEGKIRFSRRIAPVSRDYIIQMSERFGGDTPPPIDHQGINDVFEGKGAVIRYCYDGRWLELTGDQTGKD
jgi:hypothetical protein